MKSRRFTGGVLVALFLSSLVVGQAAATDPASPWANVADPVFLRIDQKSLPHPAVNAVTQDASGFLWVGTPAGLSRYDGSHFRNYAPNKNSPDAPPGAEALVADPNDVLWIGTPSSGLFALDEATGTFRAWRADPAGRTGPRSATVVALAREPGGLLWVGGDSGLDSFDPASGRFGRADLAESGQSQPRVEAILVDHAGTVWVTTVRGLFCRPRLENAFRRFVPEGVENFGARAFFSLYEDAARRLWIGSVDVVYLLEAGRRLARTYESSKAAFALAPGEQWGIVEASPDVFWIACYDGGISIVDEATGRIRRVAVDRANSAGLTPGDVWQFFRDRSGLIWIANGPGGLLAHNEEFLAVTRGSSRADAPEIAERLRAAIAERPFLLEGGQPVSKTASIGFAAFPFAPRSPRSIAWPQVVDLADQALYRAKSRGRNRWAGLVATPGTDPELLSRILAASPEDVASGAALEFVEERIHP